MSKYFIAAALVGVFVAGIGGYHAAKQGAQGLRPVSTEQWVVYRIAGGIDPTLNPMVLPSPVFTSFAECAAQRDAINSNNSFGVVTVCRDMTKGR